MLLENIRALCNEQGITIWALERKLDIGNGVIARWEKSSPRLKAVEKVAQYFGVTVDDLLKPAQDGA